WKAARLLVPSDIGSLFEGLALWQGTKAEIRWIYHSNSSLAFIEKVTLADGSEWKPHNFPKLGKIYRGVMVRVSPAEYRAVVDDTEGKLAVALRDHVAEALSLTEYADKEFVLVTDGGQVTLVWQFLADKPEMRFFQPLDIDGDGSMRLPAN